MQTISPLFVKLWGLSGSLNTWVHCCGLVPSPRLQKLSAFKPHLFTYFHTYAFSEVGNYNLSGQIDCPTTLAIPTNLPPKPIGQMGATVRTLFICTFQCKSDIKWRLIQDFIKMYVMCNFSMKRDRVHTLDATTRMNCCRVAPVFVSCYCHSRIFVTSSQLV